MVVIDQQETELAEVQATWGPDAAKLLHLLIVQGDEGATFEEMRACSIEAPAQEIYMLQLAGYAIDRLPAPDHSALSTYLLRDARPRNWLR